MGFVPFTFIDLIDILFVAYIMYWIYRTTKGTNAPYIISGIIVVYLLWVIVKTLREVRQPEYWKNEMETYL